jgi:hypothetical protein
MYLEKSRLHRSLGSLGTSSRCQIPRFYTLGSVQRMEAKFMSTK